MDFKVGDAVRFVDFYSLEDGESIICDAPNQFIRAMEAKTVGTIIDITSSDYNIIVKFTVGDREYKEACCERDLEHAKVSSWKDYLLR